MRRWLFLRTRFYAAMGIPLTAAMAACATTSPPPPPPPPPTGSGGGSGGVLVVQNGGPTGNDIHDQADPRHPGEACGYDELREQVCGSVSGGQCGPTGESLKAYGNHTWVMRQASYASHDKAFASFVYDQPATDAYRTTITSNPPENYCCYSRCSKAVVSATPPPMPPNAMMVNEMCMPTFGSGTSAPAPNAVQCAAAMQIRGQMHSFGGVREDKCCYQVFQSMPEREIMHPRGRPLRVAGKPMQAQVHTAMGWQDGTPIATPSAAATIDRNAVAHCAATHDAGRAEGTAAERTAALDLSRIDIPDELRAAAAEAWLHEARMEHASVAAFAKLSLQLMMLGAPADLLDGAHVAARDEIAHARSCFQLASFFAGEPQAPAPWPEAGGAIDASLSELLAETLLDGCLGETVAAEEAAEAARIAQPAIASAVATIAEDERRHAELAWRIAAWACRRDPNAARAVIEQLMDALKSEIATAAPSSSCDPTLERYGVLCNHHRQQLRRHIIRDVVLPCLGALLESCTAVEVQAHSIV